MNDTYLHLALTHFPIVGSLIALILLGSGFIQKSVPLLRFGLILTAVLAVLTFIVHHTGEEAEHFVKDLPGYSHDAIHEHEEAGDLAFWAMEATGILALAGWYFLKQGFEKGRLMTLVAILGVLVSFGLMAWAGKEGGKIRHTEVYPAQTPGPEAKPEIH